MLNTENILVLDAGTTAVKALVFSPTFELLSVASRPTITTKPHAGWFEQDAMAFAESAQVALREVAASHGPFARMAITNQRESIVAWDAVTNQPLAPMILWEDERTAGTLASFDIDRQMVRERTGLDVVPYFSASKIAWLLKENETVRQAKARGTLRIGTPDSWLVAQLVDGAPHITDVTNAARTLLFNIREKRWDEQLATQFGVPIDILPVVRPTQSMYGVLRADLIGQTVPVCAVIGDQQASLAAAGFGRGTTTVTHGTGTFLIQALGDDFALVDGTYTTLAAGAREEQYAIELRVGEYGERVTAALEQGMDLLPILNEMVEATNSALKELPIRPTELVVTGGMTQDPHLAPLHEQVSGIPVRTYATYHGTALGAARLAATTILR